MAAGPRLGVDFGTSHTVAVLAWPDGRVRPLLFDGSPLLPSAVYAEPGGRLLVGRDAVHAARADPARLEPSPKRRIDDGTVRLGDRDFEISTLVAAVLAFVGQEATRVGGGPPASLTLTHPASWGVSRRLALIEGARLAGLAQPVLTPEPVAAARYFVSVLGRQINPGQGLLIYDFGAGTFDASMVIRTADGFDVRAVDGIDDLGGLDLDELIVGYAREHVPDAALWQRLLNPTTTEDRRANRALWEDVRIAKEMLSRGDSATVHVPIAGTDLVLARVDFERLVRPRLEQTVRTTSGVLRWSGLDATQLAGVFLVGGSSRIPLVTQLLRRALGVPPTAIEQPEQVVAEGALAASAPTDVPVPVPPFVVRPESPHRHLPAPPAPSGPSAPPAVPTPQPRARRRMGGPVLAGLLVLALAAAVVLVVRRPWREATGGPGSSPSPTGEPAAYQRRDRPEWLPAGWTSIGQFAPAELWFDQDEVPEGGHCGTADAVLHVVNASDSGITGCTLKQPLDVRPVTNVGVEAAVTVTTGCAGIWARTGAKGYVVATCRGRVELHVLRDRGAGPATIVGQWDLPGPRPGTVIGLLVQNTTLTVYADGRRLGSVQDTEIPSGKVNAGGLGLGERIDVSFADFRVFLPPVPSGSPAPVSRSPSGSPAPATRSASARPSGVRTP